MSKSLIKLIDYSLLPAVILVAGKAFGVLFAARIFDIEITIREYSNSIVNLSPAVSAEDLNTITAYSDLIMYCFIAAYFSFVIVKAVFLHDTHAKPELVARLANQNLLKLIQNSYEIYHMATIALAFLWIANILILVNSFSGVTMEWIAVFSTLSSIGLTTALLQDVHREIQNIKNNPGQYKWV